MSAPEQATVHVQECHLAQPCPGVNYIDGKPRDRHRWTNEEQAWTPDKYCHNCKRTCECDRFRACENRARIDEREQAAARVIEATSLSAYSVTWGNAGNPTEEVYLPRDRVLDAIAARDAQ